MHSSELSITQEFTSLCRKKRKFYPINNLNQNYKILYKGSVPQIQSGLQDKYQYVIILCFGIRKRDAYTYKLL